MPQTSNYLIYAGVVLIILGLLFSGKLGPFGKLPGDILIEKPGFILHFPITSMIILSIVISLILWLLRKT